MTATAKLLNAIKSGEGWKIKVEFIDGTDVKIGTYRFNGTTNTDLINFVRNEATKFTKVKASDYSAHIGKSIDITVPEPAPIPAPSAEDIAKELWFKDWYKLDALTHLANNGLIDKADQRITNLQTSLISRWLNSYLGDI